MTARHLPHPLDRKMRQCANPAGCDHSTGARTEHAAQAKHSMKTRHGGAAHRFFHLDTLRIHRNVHGRGEAAKYEKRAGEANRIHGQRGQ